MGRQSKRTSAPAPMESPPTGAPVVTLPGAQPVPPPPISSMLGPGAWCPPGPAQSKTPPSAPYWLAGLQHPSIASPSTRGPWWAPPVIGASANTENSDLQAWYVLPTVLVILHKQSYFVIICKDAAIWSCILFYTRVKANSISLRCFCSLTLLFALQLHGYLCDCLVKRCSV